MRKNTDFSLVAKLLYYQGMSVRLFVFYTSNQAKNQIKFYDEKITYFFFSNEALLYLGEKEKNVYMYI